ncbi:MAG: Rpn family recombination-promoting nuclease/putative transposase [Fibrobacter sp.]|nr:Rpn family recombination-promoting nuclease/putative transposase [Fibrobacter sp.]
MNRMQMKEFLKELYNTRKSGGDILKVIADYEAKYKNVYFFNDFCAKFILTQKENLPMTADLVNAALQLTGSDCITNPRIEIPVVSGGPIYRDIEEDVLLSQARFDSKGKKIPGDLIGIEFQHKGGSFYNNRLVFYVARHVGNMLKEGEFYTELQNLNLISFQMFDYLPWKVSRQYRHTVRFMDDEHNTFNRLQTITIIEVNKFLEHAGTEFANDKSRLAQWLRAINALNENLDFSEFARDEIFARLQKWVEMSRFTPEAFVKAGKHMNMKDDVEIAAFLAAEKVRKEYEAREAAYEAREAAYESEKAAYEAREAAYETEKAALLARIKELEAVQKS